MRHLLGAQRGAGCDIELTGKRNAGIHQCFKLCFLIGIAVEIGAAGELRHLLVDQFLLVIAVAQAFVHIGRVGVEGSEHVVAAQPLAVIGKGWVGFN